MNPRASDLPSKYIDEMKEWMISLISSIPTENVSQYISEWAEEKRSLPSGLTARPGPVNFDVTPHLREIVDCLSIPSPVIEVAFVKGTQEGGTVMIIENAIGYFIDHGIGPQLLVSGDQSMAEDSMATKVDDLIQSAGLYGKIQPVVVKKKGRATGDRKDIKAYAGTFIRAIGPNSESKARSFPSMINYLDEIDVYPQTIVKGGTSTGNPIEKILRRADSYGSRKKIFYISTPKEEATSQIWPVYEQGDKRQYMFNCPHCGHQQKIEWKNIEWEKDEDGKLKLEYREIDNEPIVINDPVWLNCSSDKKCKIRNSSKYDMLLEKGRGGTAQWVPTKKPNRPGLRSYKSNALYGFRTWMDIVIQFERVKHDPLLLPDFVNDVLGETWKESAQKPDMSILQQNAENWPRGHINNDVLFLTLAVDIQGDRIELGLMGWGRKKQAWMIDYWTFSGEPRELGSSVWLKLDEIISGDYYREDGLIMGISITFIDKQYLTSTVEAFCDNYIYDPNSTSGVFPIESRESQSQVVKKLKGDYATPVICLHDQKLKKAIYTSLKKLPGADGKYPYGYFHFSEEYDKVFYEQLLAEDFITKIDSNGRKKTIIANPKQKRNEVGDIVKMNLAGLEFAIQSHFEQLNKVRKLNKQKEIEINHDYFFDKCEASLDVEAIEEGEKTLEKPPL